MFSLLVGILGLSSIIFSALKYNRDDTTAVLQQQNTIFGEMKTMNDELRTATEDCKGERDQLKTEVSSLREALGRHDTRELNS